MSWIKVYSTSDPSEAAIIKGALEHAGIPVADLNKQDSMYVVSLPGNHELLVPSGFEAQASDVIDQMLHRLPAPAAKPEGE